MVGLNRNNVHEGVLLIRGMGSYGPLCKFAMHDIFLRCLSCINGRVIAFSIQSIRLGSTDTFPPQEICEVLSLIKHIRKNLYNIFLTDYFLK